MTTTVNAIEVPKTEEALRKIAKIWEDAVYVSESSENPEEIEHANTRSIACQRAMDASPIYIDEDDKVVIKSSSAPQNNAIQLEGLDEAIQAALTDLSLSIYEVKVGLRNTLDPHEVCNTVTVAVADTDEMNVAWSAMAFCKERHPAFSYSVESDSVLLSLDNINRVKKVMTYTEGAKIDEIITKLTGMESKFQRASSWIINGQSLNPTEVAQLMIKSLCSKSHEALDEAMTYFAVGPKHISGDGLPVGLDKAISAALQNESLSIYEVEMCLFDPDKNQHTANKIITVTVASESIGDSEVKAIKFCKEQFGESMTFGTWGLPNLTFTNNNIYIVKYMLETAGGTTIYDAFYQATGTHCDYDGDATWSINGKPVDQNEMARLIIKGLYNKRGDELREAMRYFEDEACTSKMGA